MTHGQSVSSCFYRGKSKQTTNQLTLKLKRGLTCKVSYNKPKNTQRLFFSVYPNWAVTDLQLLKHRFMLSIDVLII